MARKFASKIRNAEKIMKLYDEYEKIIQQRKNLDGDISYEDNPLIPETVKLMTADIQKTIEFLDRDCTEEQFVWLSEVFDEIAEKTKSGDFIKALRRTAERFPEVTKKYNIEYFIDSASEYVM